MRFFIKKSRKNLINSTLNFIKFLYPKYLGLITCYFFRKNTTFIKSKYSKNRQWSKSIVYFGLWFGVISAHTITYYTYRFTFELSYMWWLPAVCTSMLLITRIKKNIVHLNINFIKLWLY